MNEASALKALEEDLNSRINPEKSRKFSEEHFLKTREKLHSLGSLPEFISDAVRISVVGTNGKGSVAWYLSLAAEEAAGSGNAGLYTSPHLIHFTERIRTGGRSLSPEEGLLHLEEIRRITGDELYHDLSYFEILTLMAIRQFRKSGCHTEIYEAGIGGRLDATRMVTADYAVLTSAGLDHTEMLGSSFSDILREKLGILTEKAKTLFIMLPPPDSIHFMDAETLKNSVYDYIYLNHLKTETFFYPYQDAGYLHRNALFADAVISSVYRTDSVFNKIKNRKPPGRCEIGYLDIPGKNLRVIFDTAHNPQAADLVIRELRTGFRLKPESTAVIAYLTADRKPELLKSVFSDHGISTVYFLKELVSGEALDFAAALPESITDLLFLGSHRTYSIYRDLTDKRNNI